MRRRSNLARNLQIPGTGEGRSGRGATGTLTSFLPRDQSPSPLLSNWYGATIYTEAGSLQPIKMASVPIRQRLIHHEPFLSCPFGPLKRLFPFSELSQPFFQMNVKSPRPVININSQANTYP